MSKYNVPQLPLNLDLETPILLRALNAATRQLAELKGLVKTIPNENILISTLTLQEAQDSSAVENIITTQDELFRAELNLDGRPSIATKEVQRYAEALRNGFSMVRRHGLITLNYILEIQASLEKNNAGVRRAPGTKLLNDRTGEVVYTPPQHPDEIRNLMSNLVSFINDDEVSSLDPIIKMAIIHHQFESIHPFYDGNGRTGRILNILYLVNQELLDLPILYLSRYIIRNKEEYYVRLQQVRDAGDWEAWILYMLRGVEQTATKTIKLVSEIKALMQTYKVRMRQEMPRIYSQDLLNNLFKHPYTKIDFVMDELQVSRPTASSYLEELSKRSFVSRRKVGRSYYFINESLMALLAAP